MANQTPNSGFNGGQLQIQSQMRIEDQANQPPDIHNQGNFIQDTGSQVKYMAQGAAEIGKGAAQSAANIARGAATGAAHIAQGAADAVKKTIGANSSNNTTHPSNLDSKPNRPTSPSSMV